MYHNDYKPHDSMSNTKDHHPASTPEQNHLPRTNHRYYLMHHYTKVLQSNLKATVEQYVKVGFDAYQIQDELKKQRQTIARGQLDLLISQILGEQQ